MKTHKPPFQPWKVMEAQNQSDFDVIKRYGGVLIVVKRTDNTVQSVTPFWDEDNLKHLQDAQETFTAHKRMTKRIFLLTEDSMMFTDAMLQAIESGIVKGPPSKIANKDQDVAEHAVKIWTQFADTELPGTTS